MSDKADGASLERALARREAERRDANDRARANGIVADILGDLVADPSGDALLARVLVEVRAGRSGFPTGRAAEPTQDTALGAIAAHLDRLEAVLSGIALTVSEMPPAARSDERIDEILRTVKALRQATAQPTAPDTPRTGHATDKTPIRMPGLLDGLGEAGKADSGRSDAPAPAVRKPSVPAAAPEGLPQASTSPAPAKGRAAPALDKTPVGDREVPVDPGAGKRGLRNGPTNDIVEVLVLCTKDHGRPVTLTELMVAVEEHGLNRIRDEKFSDTDKDPDTQFRKYVADILAKYATRLEAPKGGVAEHAYLYAETPLPAVVGPAYGRVLLPRTLARAAKAQVDIYNNRVPGSGSLEILFRSPDGPQPLKPEPLAG